MAPILTILLAITLASLSLYAGQKSYLAIINLYSNEDRAEKAAKHSDKAWRELWRTRLTQASGATTVCIIGSKPHSLDKQPLCVSHPQQEILEEVCNV